MSTHWTSESDKGRLFTLWFCKLVVSRNHYATLGLIFIRVTNNLLLLTDFKYFSHVHPIFTIQFTYIANRGLLVQFQVEFIYSYCLWTELVLTDIFEGLRGRVIRWRWFSASIPRQTIKGRNLTSLSNVNIDRDSSKCLNPNQTVPMNRWNNRFGSCFCQY